jgi:hypothetical protein
MLGPAAHLISAMGLYNASSRGLVYRVSKQGRTSLEHPACKGSSTGISERGNLLTSGSTSLKRSGSPRIWAYGSIYGLHESSPLLSHRLRDEGTASVNLGKSWSIRQAHRSQMYL